MLHKRTNNDSEGWHNRLYHGVGRRKLPSYMLIEALYKESLYVYVQKRLMQTVCLATYNKSAYKKINDKLMSLREDYNNGDKKNDEIIRICAKMFAPVEVSKNIFN
jgi:hypothetical protein